MRASTHDEIQILPGRVSGVICTSSWIDLSANCHLTQTMPTFEPEKSLLNAKFEGYKLDAIDQDAVLSRFRLEHPLTQTSAAGRLPLTFHEVQSRIRHNHLTVSPDGSAVYIDEELRVIRIIVNDVSGYTYVRRGIC